jgi:hypothetical protein
MAFQTLSLADGSTKRMILEHSATSRLTEDGGQILPEELRMKRSLADRGYRP